MISVSGKPSITICIPTRNRPQGLNALLDSLQQQSDPDFEVLIGDNSPDGNVQQMVDDYRKTSTLKNLRYVNYPHGGVQHILSKQFLEATGDVLITMGDDTTVVPGYIAAYKDFFQKHPECISASGPLLIRWNEPPPKWIEDFVKGKDILYIWGNYYSGDKELLGNTVQTWGGNAGYRKEIFEFSGIRPSLLYKSYFGNSESGLAHELSQKGYMMGYIPEAVAFHHQPKSRMNIKYVCWVAAYFGVSRTYHRFHGQKRNFLLFLVEGAKITKVYWKTWLKYYYLRVTRKEYDPDTVDTYYLAYCGFYQMKYIWWLITDYCHVRVQIDQTDFRPRESLRIAEKYFNHSPKPEQK